MEGPKQGIDTPQNLKDYSKDINKDERKLNFEKDIQELLVDIKAKISEEKLKELQRRYVQEKGKILKDTNMSLNEFKELLNKKLAEYKKTEAQIQSRSMKAWVEDNISDEQVQKLEKIIKTWNIEALLLPDNKALYNIFISNIYAKKDNWEFILSDATIKEMKKKVMTLLKDKMWLVIADWEDVKLWKSMLFGNSMELITEKNWTYIIIPDKWKFSILKSWLAEMKPLVNTDKNNKPEINPNKK